MGRKPKGSAPMTHAERQAAYRERQERRQREEKQKEESLARLIVRAAERVGIAGEHAPLGPVDEADPEALRMAIKTLAWMAGDAKPPDDEQLEYIRNRMALH